MQCSECTDTQVCNASHWCREFVFIETGARAAAAAEEGSKEAEGPGEREVCRRLRCFVWIVARASKHACSLNNYPPSID